MDRSALLAKFVEVTGSDPGLARDLLAGKQWNWTAAMDDYIQLTGIVPASNVKPTVSTTNPSQQHPAPPSQSTAPNSAPVARQPINANPAISRQPGPSRQLAPSLQDHSQQLSMQQSRQLPQPLPDQKVVQAVETTSSMSNHSSTNVGGSSSSSSGGWGREVSSQPSQSELKLFIPNPEEKDAPRSPAPTKKLQRGISKANCALVDLSRKKVTEDEHDHAHHLVDTPMYTFILPDLALFPAEFRSFVEKDLLEVTTMANLEHTGRLNWWADGNVCSRLWPMATTGDGNCLLHAASLGMWGFHDRQLTLRKALYHALTDNPHSPRMQKLKRRWRWQQTEVNQKSGLVYTEVEWEEEWKGLLRLASAEPRTPLPGSSKGFLPPLSEEKPPTPTDNEDELTYESLEEFHVFVLAHILRRPIIVVSDTMLRDADGEAFAPISFGGIYLPLEVPYRNCEASPLVLTYDTAHFSALVPMEQDLEDFDHLDGTTSALPVVIPVTDCDHRLLPVHFAVDPGVSWQWNNSNKPGNQQDKSLSTIDKLKLLHQYMNLVKIPVHTSARRDDSSERERQPPVRSPNGLTAKFSRGNSTESNRGDKVQQERGSFGKKLKYFAKLEKHKNGGTSTGDKNVPLSERKIGPITVADLEDPTIIIGSRMSERRHQLQEEMIKNYIDKAKERFVEERQQKRLLKGENRHRQEQQATSRLSPPRNWDDSHTKSREVYHEDPRAQGYHRQEQGYQNRQPSPEVYRRYNQQPTHLNVYQAPLTHTKSNPIPQATMVQSQYHMPVLTSHSGARPTSYQYGYQLDAPAEATILVNQINVQPQHQANRQPPHEDRPGAIGKLVLGLHQLHVEPTSVYQQTPSQSVPQPARSPQIARSAKVASQIPHQSTSGGSLVPQSVPAGSRSPQAPRSTQALPSPQSPKALSKSAKPTKSKDSKGKKNMVSRPCKIKSCAFYGTESTDFLCSQCYDAKITKNAKANRK